MAYGLWLYFRRVQLRRELNFINSLFLTASLHLQESAYFIIDIIRCGIQNSIFYCSFFIELQLDYIFINKRITPLHTYNFIFALLNKTHPEKGFPLKPGIPVSLSGSTQESFNNLSANLQLSSQTGFFISVYIFASACHPHVGPVAGFALFNIHNIFL